MLSLFHRSSGIEKRLRRKDAVKRKSSSVEAKVRMRFFFFLPFQLIQRPSLKVLHWMRIYLSQPIWENHQPSLFFEPWIPEITFLSELQVGGNVPRSFSGWYYLQTSTEGSWNISPTVWYFLQTSTEGSWNISPVVQREHNPDN